MDRQIMVLVFHSVNVTNGDVIAKDEEILWLDAVSCSSFGHTTNQPREARESFYFLKKKAVVAACIVSVSEFYLYRQITNRKLINILSTLKHSYI